MEDGEQVAASTARVLVVIHFFPPHIGGMEEVARLQVRSLARRGHPVTVFTCSHNRELPRLSAQGGCTVRRARATNVLERRFGITFPIPAPFEALRLARAVASADVVHLHDVFYLSSHLAFVAARLWRKPYFLTQHVAIVDHPSRLVTAVQKVVYRTIGAAMFRHAEELIVYNARVRDFVLGLGADPGRVVMRHNGVDVGRYLASGVGDDKRELRARYGVPLDKPVALFVGRLVPKKGFDLVIRAACSDYTTLVVGEGAGPLRCPGPDVVLFGPATPDQLIDLYRLSDVFVFPTLGELFTLVMQEAMAAGLPVVTTDDPAYEEYGLDRTGITLIERTPEAIRQAVREVLSSPDRAARMSEYSRRLAFERFDWETNYDDEYSSYGFREEHAHVAGAAR